MSPVAGNFDERLQHWKLADAEASEASERLRVALRQGVDADKAAELHGELLRRRDYADSLITELLQDMNRHPGDSGQ